jgi:PEP-CTERM motif
MRALILHKSACSFKALVLFVAVAVFLGSGIGSAYAGPVYIRYQVMNNDPTRTADDLTLTFNKPVLTEIVNVMGMKATFIKDAESFTFGASVLQNPGMTATFTSATNSVKTGEVDLGVVAFPEKTQGIKVVSGEWSYPLGANLAIPINQITVRGWKKDDGVILITNDDSQTLYFTGVLASTNIPSSNFLDPTESQLLALISSNLFAVDPQPDFSLAPGETKEIDLGPDMGDNYTSVIFTADFTPIPSSTATHLGFAGNDELVPEPASWMLLGLGLILLAAVGPGRAGKELYNARRKGAFVLTSAAGARMTGRTLTGELYAKRPSCDTYQLGG